uniref:SANT domain-containing protein n=1 Tax=Strongyloides stercoralis TaxID=6248 RepID=A0A0K0DYL9_STRER
MDISDNFDFVYLSNWVIKFLEGDHNDFDIVLEGIIGKNSLSLNENEYYRTNSIVKILKYNTIICDGNVQILLTSQVNEQDMFDIGFTKEYISCFKYGFPINWIDLLEYFYDRIREGNDLSLPNELFEVAFKNMSEYEAYDVDNIITLINWNVSLSLCGEDDFNVILNGTIKNYDGDTKSIIELIRERESIDLVSCNNKKLYKLESMINVHQMIEFGYTLEFIECFKYGFPSNWILLFDELYTQYKNSVENFIFSRNLINEAIDEMEDFEKSQETLSKNFRRYSTHLPKHDEIKHLNIIESKVIDNSKSPPLSPSTRNLLNSLNEENLNLNSKINSSSSKEILTPSVFKTSELSSMVISTPNIDKHQNLTLNNLTSFNISPIISISSDQIQKQQFELENSVTSILSINESNSDTTKNTTDYFALSHEDDILSEVRKRRVEKLGKRKIQSSPENTPTKNDKVGKKIKKSMSRKKRLKKNNTISTSFDNDIDDINYVTNVKNLFDASLGLGDLENISPGRFNFIDDSVTELLMFNDTSFKKIDNENKNPVFYLPSGKHISVKKPKSKVVEKNVSKHNPFDFEKLVYDEIEKNQAFELEDLEESDSTNI